MKKSIKNTLFTTAYGAACFLMGISIPQKTDVESRVQIFSEPNQPKVLRVYNCFERDDIFVQDANCPNSNHFISFPKYIDSFKNKYDRNIEKNRIKKLVYQ